MNTASARWPIETGTFSLGDLPVEHGGVIRDAKIVWQTHGTLNAARDNVVIYPTSYGGQHADLNWIIGPDGILDPREWFIIIPNMFSNGMSSGAAETPDYPGIVTAADNVRAQQRLLAEIFGIEHVAAVYGWSMGGQQAYHWAALYPDRVARAIVVCGSAKTSTHNKVFILGLRAILEAAPQHIGGGRFSAEPEAALKAFATAYAGWALSQDLYRQDLHLQAFGAPDLETFLQVHWVDRYRARRAANLYAQLVTWYHNDIAGSGRHGGSLARALAAIQAKVLLMPGDTDLYFRVADSAAEAAHLKRAELHPIPSIWGHRAGNPSLNPDDLAFVRSHVRRFLAT